MLPGRPARFPLQSWADDATWPGYSKHLEASLLYKGYISDVIWRAIPRFHLSTTQLIPHNSWNKIMPPTLSLKLLSIECLPTPTCAVSKLAKNERRNGWLHRGYTCPYQRSATTCLVPYFKTNIYRWLKDLERSWQSDWVQQVSPTHHGPILNFSEFFDRDQRTSGTLGDSNPGGIERRKLVIATPISMTCAECAISWMNLRKLRNI